jgi:hypothetical protein
LRELAVTGRKTEIRSRKKVNLPEVHTLAARLLPNLRFPLISPNPTVLCSWKVLVCSVSRGEGCIYTAVLDHGWASFYHGGVSDLYLLGYVEGKEDWSVQGFLLLSSLLQVTSPSYLLHFS